jgi:hypothetical protein
MQPQAMIAIHRVSEITGDANPYRCLRLFIPQMYIPEGNHRVGLTVKNHVAHHAGEWSWVGVKSR